MHGYSSIDSLYDEQHLASKKDLRLINSLINKCEKIRHSKFITKHSIEISSLEIKWWNIFIDLHDDAYDSIWNTELWIEFKNYYWEWYKFTYEELWLVYAS